MVYKFTWYNYHKNKYVIVKRMDMITQTVAQILDEDGDWYNVNISELRYYNGKL